MESRCASRNKVFAERGETKMKEIAVAFCSDRNMEEPLHVAASSVLRKVGTGYSVHFYLNAHGINIDLLKQTLNMVGRPYALTLLPNIDAASEYAGFQPLHGNLTHFHRLFLAHQVSAPRILYLDTDTLTNLDVGRIFDLDMTDENGQDYPFAAVIDGSSSTSGDGKMYQQLGIPPGTPVFNSGVCVFNRTSWIAGDYTRKALDICATGVANGDQTALNLLFHRRVYDIGKSYNYTVYPQYRYDQLPEEAILHFVGSPKPWDIAGRWVHPQAMTYYRALTATAIHAVKSNAWLKLSAWKRAYRVKGGYYRVARLLLGLSQ
jgi:lipopolysaccharide biosynthesis glycosyltransferase